MVRRTSAGAFTGTTLVVALLAALLFVPVTASAAPIQYQVNFGATAADPAGGVGVFFWDDATHLISNFTWDFGGGKTGGLDDGAINWSSVVFGGTVAEFTFEILTLQDVHPTGCSTPAVSCGSTFNAGQVLGYPNASVEFSEGGATNLRQYRFGGAAAAPFTTQLAQVPEPGTLTLIALAGAGAIARRRRAR